MNRPLVERGIREREKPPLPFPFLAIFSPDREPVHRLVRSVHFFETSEILEFVLWSIEI